MLIDEDELVGGEFHLVGEIHICGAVRRVDVCDAPQDFPVAGADEMLAYNPFIAWVAGIDEVYRADGGRAVGLFHGDEVNACAVLEAAPLPVVDAGLVPSVEDFAAFGGVVAQQLFVGALDNGHVVGAFFP